MNSSPHPSRAPGDGQVRDDDPLGIRRVGGQLVLAKQHLGGVLVDRDRALDMRRAAPTLPMSSEIVPPAHTMSG